MVGKTLSKVIAKPKPKPKKKTTTTTKAKGPPPGGYNRFGSMMKELNKEAERVAKTSKPKKPLTKGQLLNKRLKEKAAEYKAMGGVDKAKSALAKVDHYELRGVGRPISLDIAIYEAQKYIRELAKKSGMSVKKWRSMNLKNKWVKQLHKHKGNLETMDKKKAAANKSKAK